MNSPSELNGYETVSQRGFDACSNNNVKTFSEPRCSILFKSAPEYLTMSPQKINSPPEASLLSPSLHSKEGVEVLNNLTDFSKQLAEHIFIKLFVGHKTVSQRGFDA